MMDRCSSIFFIANVDNIIARDRSMTQQPEDSPVSLPFQLDLAHFVQFVADRLPVNIANGYRTASSVFTHTFVCFHQ